MSISVVVCANKNYLPGAFVTLGSMLDSNGGRDDFVLHVLDTGIGEAGRGALARFIATFPNAELRFHTVDTSCFQNAPRHFGGDLSAYARLLMGSLIGGPKCVYTDVDVIFLKDVAELWRAPLDGKIVRAVRYDGVPANPAGTLDYDCPFMPREEARNYPYYHSGIFLCDLDAWRASGMERKAFELLHEAGGKIKLHDQTILNWLWRDNVGDLDNSWCRLADCSPLREDTVWHFYTNRKPWARRTFVTANILWETYYRMRVRPFYRFRRPPAVFRFNLAWELRTRFFAFVLTETYLKYLRMRGKPEILVNATRVTFAAYRAYLSRGLDAQSESVLKYYKSFLISRNS